MTDMFTLILAFLLTFYDPNLADAPTLLLPAVAVRSETKEGLRLEVRKEAVMLDGAVLLTLGGGSRLPAGLAPGAILPGVQDALSARHTDDLDLLVACDKTVPYGVVASVLASASAAGFKDYRFVVESTR